MSTPKIAAGELRHCVSIRRWSETRTTNEYGEKVEAERSNELPPDNERWAKVEPLSGRELWNAAQVQANVTHRITMRGRVALTPKDTIEFRERRFEVVSATDVEERGIKTIVMAIERV